jgi:hypothetical protein
MHCDRVLILPQDSHQLSSIAITACRRPFSQICGAPSNTWRRSASRRSYHDYIRAYLDDDILSRPSKPRPVGHSRRCSCRRSQVSLQLNAQACTTSHAYHNMERHRYAWFEARPGGTAAWRLSNAHSSSSLCACMQPRSTSTKVDNSLSIQAHDGGVAWMLMTRATLHWHDERPRSESRT